MLLTGFLKALGYTYRDRKPIKVADDEGSRQNRIRQFLLEYSAAVRDPNVVVCYMDESYINQHHACRFSCVAEEDPTSAVQRKQTRGRRLVQGSCIQLLNMLHGHGPPPW